jgi:hypothetical protein
MQVKLNGTAGCNFARQMQGPGLTRTSGSSPSGSSRAKHRATHWQAAAPARQQFLGMGKRARRWTRWKLAREAYETARYNKQVRAGCVISMYRSRYGPDLFFVCDFRTCLTNSTGVTYTRIISGTLYCAKLYIFYTVFLVCTYLDFFIVPVFCKNWLVTS